MSEICKFTLHNPTNFNREDIGVATISFTAGECAGVPTLHTNLGRAGVLPIAYHSDGSVHYAQIQVPCKLDAWKSQEVVVTTADEAAAPLDFIWNDKLRDHLVDLYQAKIQLLTVNNMRYETSLIGNPVLVSATGAQTCIKMRTLLKPVDLGIPGPPSFFSATSYFIFSTGLSHVDLILQLGNDYYDDPIGPVRFKSVVLSTPGFWLAPWFYAQNQVMSIAPETVVLLKDSYLGDLQNKVWRFTLVPRNETNISSAVAHLSFPLVGVLPAQYWHGFGATPVLREVPDVKAVLERHLNSWYSRNHFGPFGTWGDEYISSTTGTPRNFVCTPEFLLAIRGEDPRLIPVLLGRSYQQACRPLHYYGLKINEEDDIFVWEGAMERASANKLGRYTYTYKSEKDPYVEHRPIEMVDPNWFQPHGWNGLDSEHWSIDYLYETYLLTGDPWVKDEILHTNEVLNGYMRFKKYSSQWVQAARAEGWCQKAWALAYEISMDYRIKRFAVRRLKEIVMAESKGSLLDVHPSHCLTDMEIAVAWSHMPEHTKCFMAWQHSAIMLGFWKAGEVFAVPEYHEIAEFVMDCIDYSWVDLPGKRGYRKYTPTKAANGDPIPANHFDGQDGHPYDVNTGEMNQFFVSALYWIYKFSPNEGRREQAKKILDNLYTGMTDIYRNKWQSGMGSLD